MIEKNIFHEKNDHEGDNLPNYISLSITNKNSLVFKRFQTILNQIHNWDTNIYKT